MGEQANLERFYILLLYKIKYTYFNKEKKFDKKNNRLITEKLFCFMYCLSNSMDGFYNDWLDNFEVEYELRVLWEKYP